MSALQVLFSPRVASTVPRRSSAMRAALAVLLMSTCAACSNSTRQGWDGRRGYDGNGDYGYDLAASRAEAREYRQLASRYYPPPGTADDPWGPYIRQAAARYQVPERWIREVMRQESGGRQQSADGTLTISGAGAMGLMQVMPATYDALRRRYRLGADPYDPQDNILAGTAYIREMYDRYGSPNFLAAYNAGPDRLDAYLAGDGTLPDETINYLASVAPRLGADMRTNGMSPAYAGGAASPDANAVDSRDRAFDGGGLVTADAPTGVLTAAAGNTGNAQSPAPVLVMATAPARTTSSGGLQRAPVMPVSNSSPAMERGMPPGAWAVQVGAFPDPAASRAAIAAALDRAGRQLAGSQTAIIPINRSGMLFRARFVGLSADNARAACTVLERDGISCFTVPPG